MNRASRRRACVRCGELKVRCTLPESSTTCIRCARLGLQCVSAAHTRPPPSVVKKDRIDLLQEQIDSLAAQLAKTNRETDPASPREESASSRESQLPPAALLISSPQCPEPAGECTVSDDIFARRLLTVSFGEQLLAKFREKKMPLFPFVIITPKMDLATLRSQYPFLLLTIMAASTEDDLSLQRKLEKEIRTAICSHLVMAAERNMDLLLGLLVHAAWHHYYFTTVRRQLYMALQMAIANIIDLGLDRDHNFGLRDIAAEVQGREDDNAAAWHHTCVEKRALLGCYYLHSVSSMFRKQLYMRHTEWIDRCCDDLAARPEYPSDVHLKMYIDIQILSRKCEELICSQDTISNDVISRDAFNARLNALVEKSEQLLREGYKESSTFPCSLLRDLHAIPIYLYRAFVHRAKPNVNASPTDRMVRDLFSSSVNCITTACEMPPDIFIHLPQTSHTLVWYSLLLATILALSSSNSGGDSGNVKTVYDLAQANNALHKSLSIGDDVWAISQRAIGFVIAWLERYKEQGLQKSLNDYLQPMQIVPDGGIPRVANPANNPSPYSISQSISGPLESVENQFAFDSMMWEEFTLMPMAFPPDLGCQFQWPSI